jgi:hypothetical protein
MIMKYLKMLSILVLLIITLIFFYRLPSILITNNIPLYPNSYCEKYTSGKPLGNGRLAKCPIGCIEGKQDEKYPHEFRRENETVIFGLAPPPTPRCKGW